MKTVAAGFFHACGLTSAGKAYCWGDNTFGELGDGTNNNSYVPIPVATSLTFSTITSGARHACALSDGRAFCWGYGTGGAFAHSNTPVEVPGGLRFSSISGGGEQHTCALTREGTAYCWGRNWTGSLGDGTNSDSSVPVLVAGGYSFASISAGFLHTCGISKAGQALCWGSNGNGELGNGSTEPRNTPGVVSTAQIFLSLNAGVYHTCGLAKGGQALCFGGNQYGELGDGTTTPRSFPVVAASGLTFISVAVGGAHTCGIVRGGKAYCWGLNTSRQLGDGSTSDFTTAPNVVTGGFTFTSMALGGSSSCGITRDLGVWCWGNNQVGELGIGTAGDPVVAPSPVAKP